MDLEFERRLSCISTIWDLLHDAHHGTANESQAAARLLLERYGGAVHRYLLAAVRDPNIASDLSQEFALRMIRGDFHRVAPENGRFRQYVKAVLFHMVGRYRSGQSQENKRRKSASLSDLPEAPDDSERLFQESWCDQLLARTWDALSQAQPRYHAALLARAATPEASSDELAAELGRQLDEPLTAAAFRQLLKRARKRFAQLLIEQVAHSIQPATPAEIEDELASLGLLEYCRPVLDTNA